MFTSVAPYLLWFKTKWFDFENLHLFLGAGGVHNGHFNTQEPGKGVLCSQEQSWGSKQTRTIP